MDVFCPCKVTGHRLQYISEAKYFENYAAEIDLILEGSSIHLPEKAEMSLRVLLCLVDQEQ